MKDPGTASAVAGVFLRCGVPGRNCRFSARAKNAGWRIDYFCVSESLKDTLVDAKIHTEVLGSDHCPVELDIQ